jgi:hypothetical protein
VSVFSNPATGGNRLDWNTVHGELLVFVPIDQRFEVATDFGTKDPVVADVHILSGEHQGDYEPGVWVFPGVLISQLKSKITADGSALVLGRLGKEPTTKGNPAWKLADPTAEDTATAERWYGWRKGQGLPFTSVTKPAFAAASTPPAEATPAAAPAAAPAATQSSGWSHQAPQGATAPAQPAAATATGGTTPPF